MGLNLNEIDMIDLANAMIKFDDYMRSGGSLNVEADEATVNTFRPKNMYNLDTEKDTSDNNNFYGPSL